MKHRLMVIASGAALVAGLVAATTADAHGPVFETTIV